MDRSSTLVIEGLGDISNVIQNKLSVKKRTESISALFTINARAAKDLHVAH